jgi:RNA polymerase sigma-70 factor (ECF subfamily)
MDSRIKKLCQRAKKADKTAANELLQIYYKDIYAYLRRLCSSQHEAEDLTQQTFLKVWSSLNSFAGHSKFSTWLYRIAHNTLIDWQRSNTAHAAQSQQDEWWNECIDHKPGPVACVAECQIAQCLYHAVEQLNEDKRHIVHLHYYQGLSIRETAKVLGIATSTVKYRLREVFKILRPKLNVEETGFEQSQTILIARREPL